MNSPTQPLFYHLHGFDPELLDRCVADNALANHMQIEPGCLDGEFGRIPLTTSTLLTCRHSVGMRVRLRFPADQVFLLLCLDVPTPSRILGRDVSRDTVVAFEPGCVMENLHGAGMCWAGLSIPFNLLARKLQSNSVIAVVSRGASLFQQPALSAMTALRAVLASITDQARRQPERFDDADWRSGVEQNLIDTFLEAFDAPIDQSQRATIGRSTRADTIVCKLDNYLDSVNGMVTVADLCRIAQLPRRTLERAYHQSLHLGPSEYVRRRALNAVRRELLHAPGATGSVTESAMRHGFWHLGRFAGYYRTLFGESPSATLHRKIPEAQPIR